MSATITTHSTVDLSDAPVDIFSLGRGLSSFSAGAALESDGRRKDDHINSQPPQPDESSSSNASWEHRQSMYVRVVDEMLTTVLEHESYLFTARELATLEHFQSLPYGQKYLLTRLLLRSETRILGVGRLIERYSSELGEANMRPLMKALIQPLDLPEDKVVATDNTFLTEQKWEALVLQPTTPSPEPQATPAIDSISRSVTPTPSVFSNADDPIVIDDSSDEDTKPTAAPTQPTAPFGLDLELKPEDMQIDLSPEEQKRDPELARILRMSAFEALQRSKATSSSTAEIAYTYNVRGKGKQVVTREQEDEFYRMNKAAKGPLVAFCRGEQDMTVDELITELPMTDLASIARELKCWRSKYSKPEVIQALLSSANTQTRLDFSAPRANTDTSLTPKRDIQTTLPFKRANSASASAGGKSLLFSKVLERFGGIALQVTMPFRELIWRVNLVYYRSSIMPQSGKAKSLMLPEILKSSSKRCYPDVKTERSVIWPTREALLEYERALELEAIVDEALGEQNHSTGTWIGPSGFGFGTRGGRLEGAKRTRRIWQGIYAKWQEEVKIAQAKNDVKQTGSRHVLDRFALGHILTRLVSKGATALGILHEYDLEIEVLRSLLAQRVWRRGKRGAWYDRLALVLMHHYQGDVVKKRQAVEVCLDALEDPDTHLIYLPRLSRRLRRLEKQLDLPPDECHICEATLQQSKDRTIVAERVAKPLIPKRGRVMTPGDDDDDGKQAGMPIYSGKTWWQGRGDELVSVEQRVIEWWEDRDYKGYHSESSILTTLFGILFWPVLFADIPGAFETPYQLAPLDLGDDSFYWSRRDMIEERLDRMSSTKQTLQMLREVDDAEREKGTLAVGVRWDYPKKDLEEIVQCMGGRSLAVLCRMFCEEYGHRSSGVPDLM